MRRCSWLPVLALVLVAAEGCSSRTQITAPSTPKLPHYTDIAPDTARRGPGTLGGGN